MREAFVSILLLAAAVRCLDLGKDVNYYKDYLRARSDEMPEPAAVERMLYFYRTPLQLYPGLLPVLEQEYKKRTGNVFKNHMLNKDLWVEGAAPNKRSSKTALSLMLQGKQPYHVSRTSQTFFLKTISTVWLKFVRDEEHYCPYGK